MVSGTFILTDTMQKTFDGLFAASYDETDAVIEGKEIVESSLSGAATVPASLLAEVRALPQVEAAGGTVAPAEVNSRRHHRRRRQGRRQGEPGRQHRRREPALQPAQAQDRRLARRARAGRDRRRHRREASTTRSATPSRWRRTAKTATYQVTGTASLRRGRLARLRQHRVWDVETAQALLDREGHFDSISIAAKDGTSPAELVRAVQPLVPNTLEVQDSAKQAEEASAQLDEGMSYIRYFLLGFGGIALFVGAFVIFNTLSITVAQRTREFATLRTLGASRKQVLRSVKLEGLVIGLLASVIGLFLGFGVAKGMLALFSAMGVDLPKADTVFALRTVIVSLLLGTGITLLATIIPARRATRVPPIAAVREGSTLPASRFAAHSRNTGLGVVAGVAGRDLRRRLRRRQRRRRRAAARARRDRALPGHRAARPAARQAAGAPRRLARAPCRRRRRRAGRRERRPQPLADGVDRRRADDRADARDGRGGARRRHEQVDEVGGHRPDPRRLRHRRQRRRSVPRPPRATSSRRCPA